MACKFNKYKSIHKGVPNIAFMAAYLLFSAEVCTGPLKNRPSSHISNLLPLSLAAKPVDQLDTIEELAQFEGNADWLHLYHANRLGLSVNVSTASSKLPLVPIASGAKIPKKLAVAPIVGEGIAPDPPVAVVPLEEEGIASDPPVEVVPLEEEGILVKASEVPIEVAEEGVAQSTSSPETRQESDNVHHVDQNISSKPVFNRIELRKAVWIPLAPFFSEDFGTHSTNGIVTLDLPGDNRLLGQPMENDATENVQEQKIIQEMKDMVNTCEGYENSSCILTGN